MFSKTGQDRGVDVDVGVGVGVGVGLLVEGHEGIFTIDWFVLYNGSGPAVIFYSIEITFLTK